MRRAATRIGAHQGMADSRAPERERPSQDRERPSQDRLGQALLPAWFCTPRGDRRGMPTRLRSHQRLGAASSPTAHSCGESTKRCRRPLPLLSVLLGCVSLLAAALAVGASPASAKEALPLEFEIGSTGEAAGQFSELAGVPNSPVAVDQSTGDIYVGDSGNDRVEKFSASGEFILMFGGGVDETTGANVCTVASGDVCGAGKPDPSPSGEGHGFFGEPGESTTGIAVDQNTHRVYVTDRSAQLIEIFTAEGEFISQFQAPSDAEVRGGNALAVDSHGNVYVADGNGCGCVRKYGPTGTPDATNPAIGFGTLLSAFAVATDSVGDLYVVDAGANDVQKFTENGTLVSSGNYALGLDSGHEPTGVAVDPRTGDVYVLDSGLNEALEYGPAGELLSSAAPENGFDLGIARGVAFDDSTSYLLFGHAVDDGHMLGAFGAPVILPDVTTEPASALQPTSATLNGTVNPVSTTVTGCRFVFGTDTSYGRFAACAESVGSGGSDVSVHADVTGLAPNTTYHERLEATNSSGTSVGKDETFTTPGPPTICQAPTVEPEHTSATVQAGLDPDGFATEYHLEYGTTSGYGTSVPVPGGALGPESECQSLSVALGNLAVGTQYHYRLVARNSAGTLEGSDETFETLPPALIESESVSDVSATSATLEAQIDPLGLDTTYRFEFGPSAAYGMSVPIPDGQLGSGSLGVPVSTHLQGLATAGLYHYRVVADNELGSSVGPDHTFITQAAEAPTSPLDNRGWEMVTPPDKQTAAVMPISEQNGLIEAAASGDALTYATTAPDEPNPQGALDETQELSVRTDRAWQQETFTLPHPGATSHSVGYGPEYRFFSSDLTHAIVQPFGPFDPSLSVEASEQTAFLRTDFASGNPSAPCTSSCYRPLVTGAPGYANVPAGVTFGDEVGGEPTENPECLVGCGPNFVAGTPDLRHVIVKAGAGLTADSKGGLYEWFAGQLTFVGVGSVGGGGNGRVEEIHNAISQDGSRVILDGKSEGAEGLLLRDTATSETVKLDAVQGGAGDGAAEPRFQGASSDDSRIFFTDPQRLTEHSGESDLYECQIVERAEKLACELTDVTPLASGESAHVAGEILGLSEDGSWVYFVASGVLAPGAVPADPNLYVAHWNGTEWSTKLIAVLSEGDIHDWLENLQEAKNQPTRVSPNGLWLAFMSQRQITDYDNRDARSGEPDAEVYLYDAVSGRVLCPSCEPTGARPLGVSYSTLESGITGGPGAWNESALVAASVPGWQQTQISGAVERYQSRYLSDTGRLFFNSDDALAPRDVNGTEDVYEFEPPGVGTCSTSSAWYAERTQGCVGLISSGISPNESGFLDASENGEDVFFLTSERLLPQDFDTSLDIYDAHVCSEVSPCLATSALEPPVCTTSDQCKPAPSSQPTGFGPPSSQTFSGAGNLATAPKAGAVKSKKPTRSQKLALALKACRKQPKKRRAVCERKAKKAYGPTRKATTKKGKNRR